ncbi:MAG: glycerophosphodiester phosphodiesterase [Tannerella sp.]|jgi:glycerophosphoryl diester phosphodiesterase|nr:glycerophosphodiester phosphodiesterase [Tannerella sp.]
MKRISLFIVLMLSVLALTSEAKKPSTPRTIAHRGYWDTEGSAQNSVASLAKAQELGVYGSEFDVWLTTDGKVALNHDGVINGVTIQDAKWDDIKDFTLSNGEKIPLLEDYLKQAKKNKKVKLILEIKSHRTPEQEKAVAEAVARIVTDAKMGKQVEYISFSINICRELARLLPKEEIAYLASGNSAYTIDELKAMNINGIDYHIGIFRAHPEYVTEAHKNKMTVNVWTVNKPEEMAEMMNLGVDFITTDNPKEALKLGKK